MDIAHPVHVLVYHMVLKFLPLRLQTKTAIHYLVKMIVIWDCVVIVAIMGIVLLLLVGWVRCELWGFVLSLRREDISEDVEGLRGIEIGRI